MPEPNWIRKAARRLAVCVCLATLTGAAGATGDHLLVPPDPASSDYLTVTETLSAASESFNHQTQKTRRVTIVGMTVVIDPTTSLNNLFDAYDNQTDIKSMEIDADTVWIRGLWHLPQTEVTLRTKTLIVWGTDAAPTSAGLVTTPISLTARPTPAGQGIDAEAGLKAGDLHVFVQDLIVSPQVLDPFIQHGGDGQPAGLGRDGAQGSSMSVYNGSLNLPSSIAWPDNTVWIYNVPLGGANPFTYFGSNNWPGDGEDAVQAGYPGRPGDGGDLYMRTGAAHLSEQSPGEWGEGGLNTAGGPPGTPVNAVHTQYVTGSGANHYVVGGQHTAVKGFDATAPQASGAAGNEGQVINVGADEPYMHPRMLSALDAWTADMVRAAKLNDAQAYIEAYLADYAWFKQTDRWGELTAAVQQQAEQYKASMEARLQKILDNAAQDWLNYR